jgi:hypothetical protein
MDPEARRILTAPIILRYLIRINPNSLYAEFNFEILNNYKSYDPHTSVGHFEVYTLGKSMIGEMVAVGRQIYEGQHRL